MKMSEKFEQSRETESSKSSKQETACYTTKKLSFKNFRKQEVQDKKDADAILKEITWENIQKWSDTENHSKQRINSDALRNMPRWKVDDNTLWSAQNMLDHYNIQRREDEYLAQHETMSESEYNKLFSGKEKLRQWQFWDCYLVSWINELARSQHFDTLMRTSIQRRKRDNWDLWYQVIMPLWHKTWRKILIKDSELGVARIKWNTWYKILELVYAKNRRPNNRIWNKYSPITQSEFARIEWWRPHEVLKKFLGKREIGFSDFWTMKNYQMWRTLFESSKHAKEEIYNFLKNYNPNIWNKFVSLASLHGSSDWKSYTVWWKTLYRKHAYSITWVKKEKWEIKSIAVLNPWNTWWAWKNYQDFTVDEFFQAFSAMWCGTINRQTFLNGKSAS